jgi:hypothetical protein
VPVRDLVPIRSIVIDTCWTPEQVRGALEERVTPLEAVRGHELERFRGPFHGVVGPRRFRIQRSVFPASRFHPVVDGEVRATAYGARVSVRVRVPPGAMAFQLFAMGAGLAVSIASLALVFVGHRAGLLVFVFPLFLVGWPALGFVPEANRAEAYLRELLPAALPHAGPYR